MSYKQHGTNGKEGKGPVSLEFGHGKERGIDGEGCAKGHKDYGEKTPEAGIQYIQALI